MGERKGKLKEAFGWATGDRQVEAEGAAEQVEDQPDEELVDEALEAKRREHQDIPTETSPSVD